MSKIYDSHYDLLTYILMKENNPRFLQKLCHEIYRDDNIIGGLINHYYMPKERMKEELGIHYIDPVYDLYITNDFIDKYNLLPNRDKFLYAIEGCSYIYTTNLKALYNLGLRSIIPVYNEDNIYGGGALGNPSRGLTSDGKKLINLAVELGIAIDISHLNKKTADDTLNYLKALKENGYCPIVLASHSNCYRIAPRKRNIPDDIIKKVGELDGIIGIMPRKTFCSNTPLNNYDNIFSEHVRHIIDLIGCDNVCIASDDMEYHPDKTYESVAMYNIRDFAKGVDKALTNNGFTTKEKEKVMVKNFKNKVLDRLKK